jgi:hypothetical protein
MTDTLTHNQATFTPQLYQWEEEPQSQLPRRGTIHDLGPTLTHKKEILEKLIFAGKSVEVVCRETQHRPEAVLRDPTNFKQVLRCRKGLQNGDIAFATKLSLRLIEEYQALIEAWGQQHPQWECSRQPRLDDLLAQLEKTTVFSR